MGKVHFLFSAVRFMLIAACREREREREREN